MTFEINPYQSLRCDRSFNGGRRRFMIGILFGAGTKSRTRDLLITNQLLYQLSYAGFFYTFIYACPTLRREIAYEVVPIIFLRVRTLKPSSRNSEIRARRFNTPYLFAATVEVSSRPVPRK